jgi:ABC-type arginine transport system permease subunit
MKKKSIFTTAILPISILLIILAIPFGYASWTDSNLEWLLSHIMNKQVHINGFVSGIIGFFGGIPMFILNLILSILK